MQAKRLIFNEKVVGYRLYTNFTIGTVDISHDVYGKHGLDFDIVGDLYLSSDGHELMSKDEIDSGVLIKDISDSIYIPDILALMTNSDIAEEAVGTVFTDDNLNGIVSPIRTLKRRYCFNDLMNSLDSKVNITIVYGVRRTGKTVLLLQAIAELLDKGIPASKILYCSVKQNVDFDSLDRLLFNSAKKLGIEYVFVDEFTYINFDSSGLYSEGNLGRYSESFLKTHFVFSGTNSAFFIPLENGIWYDRAVHISTSYVSYKEFESLYNGLTLKKYIEAGGLLFNLNDSTFNMKDHVDKYVKTAIIKNMFHAFENMSLGNSDWFVSLRNAYFSSDVRTLSSFLYKCVQRYSLAISANVVNTALKSSDINKSRDLVKRGVSIRESKDLKIFCDRLSKRFFEINNFSDFRYSNECIMEIRTFLKELDCLKECITLSGEVMDFVVPIALRYGCTMDVVRLLESEFPKLSDGLSLSFDKSYFTEKIKELTLGVLFESVIYCDLSYFCVKFDKYRLRNTKEIDLVIDNDLYEIKMTPNRSIYQLRWLFDKEIWDNLSPSSLNVIYTGVSCVETHTRREVLDAFKIPAEESDLDIDKPVAVNYINAEEFLKRDSFKDGESYESV